MREDVRKSIAELVGTFALVFVGAGSIIANEFSGGQVGLLGIALAHGLVLAVVVSATGHISGGHINPAVTIGFLITRRLPVTTGIYYMVAQLLGAVLGAMLLRVVFPEAAWTAASLGTPLVAPEISFFTAVLVEMVLTFFLVFAIFGTAGDPQGPKGIAGFGIGLVLVFDILLGGALTGASMNPARTFGPALAGTYWAGHLVYWIGPIVGAAAAAVLYHYVLQREE
jgi:aquaporin Z